MRWTSALKNVTVQKQGGPFKSMGGPLISLIFKVNPAFKDLQRLRSLNSTPGTMLRTSILETLPGDFVPGELECYHELLGQYKTWRSFHIRTEPLSIRQESGETLIGFDIKLESNSEWLYNLRHRLWNAFYQVAPELEKPTMSSLFVPICQIDHDPETIFEKIKEQRPQGLKPLKVAGLSLAGQLGAPGADFKPVKVYFDKKPAKIAMRRILSTENHVVRRILSNIGDLRDTDLESDVPVRRVTATARQTEELNRNHVAIPRRTGQGSPDSAKPHEEHDIRANLLATGPLTHRSASRWALLDPMIRSKLVRSPAMAPSSPSMSEKGTVHIPRDIPRPRIDDPASWKKTISSLF